MGGEDEGPLSRVLSELEACNRSNHEDSVAPLSEDALFRLQMLFDDGGGGELWSQLASSNLPPSALARPLSVSMESPVPRISLLAARVYLSALLSASSPIFTLFTPLPFLSLLRCLRRSLKTQPSGSQASPDAASSSQEATRLRSGRRKKKQAGGANVSTDNRNASVEDQLQHVLRLLESVLGLVRLDVISDGMKSLVEAVAGILNNPRMQHHRLSSYCFHILHGVASGPQHGDQTHSTVEVLKSLASLMFLPLKSPARSSTLKFVTSQFVPMARENDAIRKAMVYFPRYLAMKAPEKSEPRASSVEAIVEIVGTMEPEDQVAFTEFVNKLTQGKPQYRLFAVDLILSLMTTPSNPLGLGPDDPDDLIDTNHQSWRGMKCLHMLVERCSDAVAGIRARALTNLAQTIEFLSTDPKSHSVLQILIASKYGNFTSLLKKRCSDEKAMVRKAALLLIMKSLSSIRQPIDEIILKAMGHACSDPMVSIRKVAVSALSEAFRRFQDCRVITEWLLSVPRLIVDNETSIQEECENLFLELVLDWISSVSDGKLSIEGVDHESVFPKSMLALLEGTGDTEVVPYVKKICMSLGKKKKLKRALAISLQNIITTSESIWRNNSMPIEKWTAPPGAWFLLSEVSSFMPKAIDWKFLQHHWELLDHANSTYRIRSIDSVDPITVAWAGDRVSLLQTISNVSLELPPKHAAELAHNLFTRVQDFNMHLPEVDAHIKALNTLCKRKAINHDEGDALVLKWVRQISLKAVQILRNCVAEISEVTNTNSLLTPQSGMRKRRLNPESLAQAVVAVFTIGSLVLVCTSTDVKDIVPILHTIMTSPDQSSQRKKGSGLTISMQEKAPSLYIQSWVTMGKICLVDEKLAKRYIPLFIQELETSASAAVRNNILIIMTDFCVRYTSLVDSYIPKITNSLRDPCEVVRRQTFVLLSRLLQRDYVKWKGVLFLRFLLTLIDDSQKIRHLADYLFSNILKVKAPLLAYNSFVEAVFVLNDCRTHAGRCESHGSAQTTARLFSIRGNDAKSRAQRMRIYVSLLKQMAPEQLLATSAKLCAEILAAAADGLLNVDEATGQAVLQDTLQILCCKEMRLQPGRGVEASEVEDDGGDGGAAAIQAAKGRAVTQASKKNLIQHAVPIFIELKRLLESKNSPLTGCLMECLRVLLKDYKNEIEDILVADKQLQRELIYDMHKYEAAKTKSKVTEAVADVQRSDNFRSPAGNAADGGSSVYARVAEKLGTTGKVSSAVADVAAKATARSVLREIKRDAGTPPLRSMSLPKVKPGAADASGGEARSDQHMNVLESLRKRQFFDDSEEEN